LNRNEAALRQCKQFRTKRLGGIEKLMCHGDPGSKLKLIDRIILLMKLLDTLIKTILSRCNLVDTIIFLMKLVDTIIVLIKLL